MRIRVVELCDDSEGIRIRLIAVSAAYCDGGCGGCFREGLYYATRESRQVRPILAVELEYH
jgi:hypothetical protein